MNTKAKALVVTGLAIVGAVSIYMWLRKPKKNDDGFYNASGKAKLTQSGDCAWTKDSYGNMYHTGEQKNCEKGDRCVNRYA